MNDAFPGHFDLINDTSLSVNQRPAPADYATWVREKLNTLQPGDKGIVRLRRPRPTAAFSPQDTTHPGYARIRELALARGFEPIERGTGGRLTMFDEMALGITIIWPHPEPHKHTLRRYDILSGAVAAVLKGLGIEAHVGELRDEYCPGKYSVNAEGRIKLAGIAQRMNRRCVQMGAIIAVQRSDKARAAIAEAYDAMGLRFDPTTYGAITDVKPGLSDARVCQAFVEGMTATFAM